MNATERVRAAFDRIARVDRPEAWITLRDQTDALAEAARVDAAARAGEHLPLAGKVYAAKDNIDVAGMPTTAACPSFAYQPEHDATAVARLRAAGAVCLGKTNLDQFATGLVGTRSPYGAVRGTADPELISGGSSSGSAVTVALGVCDFALGTDTAGSGRVPAALNGIVGVKASLGLVPVDGVVPACHSYDCVTAFAPDLATAVAAMRAMTGPTDADPLSRDWPGDTPLAAGPTPRVAIPREADLAPVDADFRPLFADAVAGLEAAGVECVPIDVRPFLEAALLLYDGALIAERFAAFGEHIDARPDEVDPTVAEIVRGAAKFTGADLAADQQRLRGARTATRALLADFDALLLPTAPTHPTITEVQDDPIAVNAKLGTYTNFVNLLDMAAVAVPAGGAGAKGFGVSLIVPAFDDQIAVDLAARLTGEAAPLLAPAGTELVLFGAHMTGMPLNGQLTDLGARYAGQVTTAPRHRMYELDTDPPKPLVVRTGEGASLPGERWLLSPAALGRFLADLPAPMTLGKVELSDGTWATGFIANQPSGTDITTAGGWREHLS
ncbi:allophanate hydrolase [Glycomyces halotolerans]